MLYPKNDAARLSPALFEQPGAEYRGAPFWAWNCRLDRDLLLREIEQIRQMGFGGFHIHCRSGMATPYLGPEFMRLARDCDERAKRDGMLCWLYDEDRWPSGAAGGLVTKETRFRARYLVFSPHGKAPQADKGFSSTARSPRSDQRRRLVSYEIRLRDGCLAGYRRLAEGETAAADADRWDAYLEIGGPSPWFNGQTYVDTLNPAAIRRFVEVTHEAYFRELGNEFGGSVPAIFTDEPQFTPKQCLPFADSKEDVLLPWTDDFDDTYRAAYGESLLDFLPELFWELPDGKVSTARYHYHDHVSERFSAAFADTIGGWCAAHGILLTGHMMEEPTLYSQTRALGECMRSYRSFQLPGIDMLCDRREFTTAKQAASAAHQYGRPGVLSELYGVTGWDFDFRGHKLQGDWQAALGVTVRVPHLNWVSMEGEAKRDYPAAIGYQSPWYREYPLIENHFARLNTALTRGKPHVRVAVVHPVESYWLHWGPREQTAFIREEIDRNFQNLTSWLLLGLVDFDFISESLLPSQAGEPEKADGVTRLRVGRMAYDAVVVPGCETLRATTLRALRLFREAGGRVIFAGAAPRLVDAAPSDEAAEFARGCETVSFTRTGLLGALESCRDVDVRGSDGARAENLLYQLRQDGTGRWLFLCHAFPMENPDLARWEDIRIRIRGLWKPTVYDTMTGRISPCPARQEGDATVIRHRFSQHDSLLLWLEPGRDAGETPVRETPPAGQTVSLLPEPASARLSEPNVLLLDMAEYAFDDGEWQAEEELLRIDNRFRRQLGWPPRAGAHVQPWALPPEGAPIHTLHLRFCIRSDIPVAGARLALERPESMTLRLNKTAVPTGESTGWFVDESIRTLSLPPFPAGENRLELDIPFGRHTNVEWCYLLGDFAVAVHGRLAHITGPLPKPVFGNWVGQGLPFYAGNVTYRSTFDSPGGRTELEISHFRCPLLTVALDGKRVGPIAFAPYRLDLGRLTPGPHTVEIIAFGNRVNAFGAVHNANFTLRWHGPDAWRSTGAEWSYEYQLKPSGILTAPRLWVEKRPSGGE